MNRVQAVSVATGDRQHHIHARAKSVHASHGEDDALVVLGRRIRVLRAERDLPQDELARRAGIGKSHLSGIEKGRHNPSYMTLRKIAAGFEMSVGDMLRDLT